MIDHSPSRTGTPFRVSAISPRSSVARTVSRSRSGSVRLGEGIAGRGENFAQRGYRPGHRFHFLCADFPAPNHAVEGFDQLAFAGPCSKDFGNGMVIDAATAHQLRNSFARQPRRHGHSPSAVVVVATDDQKSVCRIPLAAPPSERRPPSHSPTAGHSTASRASPPSVRKWLERLPCREPLPPAETPCPSILDPLIAALTSADKANPRTDFDGSTFVVNGQFCRSGLYKDGCF
jgi:hypothetical protein